MYLEIRDIYLLNMGFNDVEEIKQITDVILVHKSYFLSNVSSKSINKKIHILPRRNISDRSTYTDDSADLDEVIKKDNYQMKEIKSVVDNYLKETQDQQDIELKLNRSISPVNRSNSPLLLKKIESRSKVKRDVSTSSISDKIKYYEQQIKMNSQ